MHDRHEVLRVPPPDLVHLRRCLEGVERVLTDRVEHPKPAAAPAAKQALDHERLECVDIRAEDGLGRLDREAASEGGEPAEQLLLLRLEQLVTPLDRGSKRALPRRRIPSA